jgi:putative ABC transport system permease protein
MLKQVFAITQLGLRSIPDRLGPSLVIVVGLAGVVAVFTALLAMAAASARRSSRQVGRTSRSCCGAVRRRS